MLVVALRKVRPSKADAIRKPLLREPLLFAQPPEIPTEQNVGLSRVVLARRLQFGLDPGALREQLTDAAWAGVRLWGVAGGHEGFSVLRLALSKVIERPSGRLDSRRSGLS